MKEQVHTNPEDSIREQGNQESITIQAWVARDDDEALYLYQNKPEKLEKLGVWRNFKGWAKQLFDVSMLSVKWEDEEPTSVEITIKVKR